jgi:dTDP-glucose pyrophosphorylase
MIITMAGLGTRFRREGHIQEKYEILFHGKTLFEWAMCSLSNFYEYEFIFLARNRPGLRDFIKSKCRLLGIRRIQIKTVDTPTRGQAETALLAGEFIGGDDSISIFNIDTHVCAAHLRPSFLRGSGWIPVFTAPGNSWSFVEMAGDGLVSRTTEKARISDYCSIGFYYFESFRDFEKLVRDSYERNADDQELYIAPLYNRYIDMGKRVYSMVIPSECVFILGTPMDISEAEARVYHICSGKAV